MSDQNAALFDKLDGFYVTKSEHDWLERRFSNMTEKEKILFQKQMLEDFARRNGLPNPMHFTDDGISGTQFAGVR